VCGQQPDTEALHRVVPGPRYPSSPATSFRQYGAGTNDNYIVPSYGQKKDLDLYAPIGLTAKGFKIPAGWGPSQLQALQSGYTNGQAILDSFIASARRRGRT